MTCNVRTKQVNATSVRTISTSSLKKCLNCPRTFIGTSLATYKQIKSRSLSRARNCIWLNQWTAKNYAPNYKKNWKKYPGINRYWSKCTQGMKTLKMGLLFQKLTIFWNLSIQNAPDYFSKDLWRWESSVIEMVSNKWKRSQTEFKSRETWSR